MSKPYTLKSPCKDCPFRSDVNRYLTPQRAQGIVDDSYEDSNFYCHKTVDYSAENGDGTVVDKSRVCAGFLITMEKEGVANQPTRIAERLGIYDRGQLDMDAPTYDSMQDWVRSYSPEESEQESEPAEHCDVVGPDCTDPAGFAQGGSVFENSDPGTCTEHCSVCSSSVCDDCTDHVETVTIAGAEQAVPVCIYCA